jgi:glycosyltransferase involved in cell wall biosynthesis
VITVLRIARKLNQEGPTRHYRLLEKELVKKFYDHDIPMRSILAGAPPLKGEADARAELRESGLTLLESIQNENDGNGCLQLIRSVQPDIIHTHGTEPMHALRWAAVTSGIPCIHTYHGHAMNGYTGDTDIEDQIKTERLLASNTDAIVVLSPSQRHDIVSRYAIAPEHKVHTIPVVPESLDTLSEAKHQPSSAFRIGMVARLEPVKNHRLLFDALLLLDKWGKTPVEVRLVGDGSLRPALESESAAMKLRRVRVQFSGWQSDLLRVYTELDVVVLTSHSEGTPLCLIEAQVAGIPLVSTSVGGVPDCVLPERSCFLVAPGDAVSLAEKLLALEQDAELRKHMGLAGRRFVREHYSVTSMVNELFKLYNKVRKHRR